MDATLSIQHDAVVSIQWLSTAVPIQYSSKVIPPIESTDRFSVPTFSVLINASSTEMPYGGFSNLIKDYKILL